VIRASVGQSRNRNLRRAVDEAVGAARARGPLDRPDLVLLFGGVGHDQAKLVSATRDATGRAPLVGCSAEGVITSAGPVEDPFAVAVALVASDDLHFHSVVAHGLRENSKRAGHALASGLREHLGEDARAILLLADGLTIDFDSLMQGWADATPFARLPIFGGTASDNWTLERTYQYVDDHVHSDAAVAVLISGAGRFVHAVNHGCVAVGAERKITKSIGNVIWEIDDKPALDVMREYVDVEGPVDWHKAVATLAIGFRAPPDLTSSYDELMIRYIPQKDDTEKWIATPTAFAPGTGIWMTRRDYGKIRDGLERMAAQLGASLGGAIPGLFFHMDCTGRGRVTFAEEEKIRLMSRLHGRVGPTSPWIGFYCYGEIAPVRGRNCFHNYTAVVAALV
jgi:hypothetical protein